MLIRGRAVSMKKFRSVLLFFSCFDFIYLNTCSSMVDIIVLLYQFMYLSRGSKVCDFQSIYWISIVQWSGRWRSMPEAMGSSPVET